MPRSALLSILARNYPPMLRASFISDYPGPWLVWEPGEWAPVPRSALTNKTVPVVARPGPRRASATIALAMHLDPPDGRPYLTLGRDPACDLHINDITLSRVHLQLSLPDGTWHVEDPGSMNGTMVNGVPLPRATPARLSDQAEIDAGDVLLTFQSTGSFFKRLHQGG